MAIKCIDDWSNTREEHSDIVSIFYLNEMVQNRRKRQSCKLLLVIRPSSANEELTLAIIKRKQIVNPLFLFKAHVH